LTFAHSHVTVAPQYMVGAGPAPTMYFKSRTSRAYLTLAYRCDVCFLHLVNTISARPLEFTNQKSTTEYNSVESTHWRSKELSECRVDYNEPVTGTKEEITVTHLI